MATRIFVNLPVKELSRSVDFFTRLAAGATIPNPASDYGFMYQHSFEDLDGHHWEFVWMDPNGLPSDKS